MKDKPCRELITACCESSHPQSWMPRGEGTTHFHGHPRGQCHLTSFQPRHSGRQPGGETGKAGGSLGTCCGGAVTCVTLGSPHSCPEGQGLTRGLRSRASSFFTSLGILQEFTCGFKPGSTISPVLRDDKKMGHATEAVCPFSEAWVLPVWGGRAGLVVPVPCSRRGAAGVGSAAARGLLLTTHPTRHGLHQQKTS